jgi:hypothetical protein
LDKERLILRAMGSWLAIPLFDRRRHRFSVPTNMRAAAVQGGRTAGAKQLYPGRSRARRHARLLLGSPLVWLVSFAVLMVASVPNELNRILSKPVAVWIGSGWDHRQTDRGRRDKSADCCRALVTVAEGDLRPPTKLPAGAFAKVSEKTIAPEPSRMPGISRPL